MSDRARNLRKKIKGKNNASDSSKSPSPDPSKSPAKPPAMACPLLNICSKIQPKLVKKEEKKEEIDPLDFFNKIESEVIKEEIPLGLDKLAPLDDQSNAEEDANNANKDKNNTGETATNKAKEEKKIKRMSIIIKRLSILDNSKLIVEDVVLPEMDPEKKALFVEYCKSLDKLINYDNLMQEDEIMKMINEKINLLKTNKKEQYEKEYKAIIDKDLESIKINNYYFFDGDSNIQKIENENIDLSKPANVMEIKDDEALDKLIEKEAFAKF